jgi:acetyltransferase-like isoleucine patch superfamily enzyme
MKPIISANIRVRYPDVFEIGEDSIIDDFCYFATQVSVGVGSHIANNCSVGGGRAHRFRLGDLSSLSAGVRIWCASDDFVRDLVALVPQGLVDPKEHVVAGDVLLGDYTAVGSNSVVMPDNRIPDGTTIGAMSFVPPRYPFEEWSVYAGVPIRRVGSRDRQSVVAQARRMREQLAGRRAG